MPVYARHCARHGEYSNKKNSQSLPPCSSYFSGGRPLINEISKIYSLSDREMLCGKVKQGRGIQMEKVVILSKVVEKASCTRKNQ